MTGPLRNLKVDRPFAGRGRIWLCAGIAIACAFAAMTIAAQPASAALVWTKRVLVEGNNDGLTRFQGVSCPTNRLCAVVDNIGNVFVSTNPVSTTQTNVKSVWKQKDIDGSTPLTGISCLPTLCVAVDQNGNVLVSTNPFKPSPTWSSPLPVDTPNKLTGISCPATNLCVAIDNVGQVITSTQPAGGASKWTKGGVDPGSGHVGNAVSCPSTKLCVAFDTVLSTHTVNSFSSTNPAGGSSTWTLHSNVDHAAQLFDFQALDCISVSLCVGADESGNGGSILTSTHPTSSTWKAAPVDTNYQTPFGVSCITPKLCFMVDDAGKVWRSTNPTGGAAAWKQNGLDPRWSLLGISCSRQGVCVAIDQGANLFVGHLPPPNTVITSANIKKAKHSATFKFTATGDAISGFQCELRKKGSPAKFLSCASPKSYSHLAKGSYAFLVRAINPAGPDPTPAKSAFTLS